MKSLSVVFLSVFLICSAFAGSCICAMNTVFPTKLIDKKTHECCHESVTSSKPAKSDYPPPCPHCGEANECKGPGCSHPQPSIAIPQPTEPDRGAIIYASPVVPVRLADLWRPLTIVTDAATTVHVSIATTVMRI